MILHAHEFCPSIPLRDVLQRGKLVRPHAAGTDVADFAGADEGVERGHGFFRWGVRVEAVDLEEVEVRGVEATEAGFHSGEDGKAGQAASVDVVFACGDICAVEDASEGVPSG